MSGQARDCGKQSSRWATNLAGGEPGEELPGRAEQVGSQADEEPTELPGGSQPSVLCMAQAPASDWETKELDLAPGGGRYNGGRGPALQTLNSRGRPVWPAPKGKHTTAVPELPPGQGPGTAVSTQLRDGCGGKEGRRGWLAEPWR